MSDITMPQLGETVTEGTITKWFKKVGERVERDELLFEVSTDKVDSEVPSSASGVLLEIRVPEGETVDVGVVLAVIGDGAPAAVPVAVAPAPEPAPVMAPPVAAAAVSAVPVSAASAASVPVGVTPDSAGADPMDKVLSPVVRRLINENNLDPQAIAGTGAGGRITREDVLAVLDAQVAAGGAGAWQREGRQDPTPQAPVVPVPVVPVASDAPTAAPPAAVAAAAVPVAPPMPAPAPVPAVAPAASVPALRPGGRDELVPFTNIRRRTGEHMLHSLHSSPHAFIAVETDYSAVDRVRARAGDGWKADEGFSLTYLPFIGRAVVDAVRKYPHINASVSGDSLIVHHSVHLGVAVDINFQGLMVPVVRDADGKRLRAIARDIHDLAGRARTKKLGPDDISGGTFTISNAGPFGIDLMQSIINQPQVAILSVTSVKRKPVVIEGADGSESIGIRPLGMLGLSWDHRAFDGAYAASFLREVQQNLESKDWSSEV